ncbi:MAG: TIGR03087 family PEP-CTERM/XrtA system glycosyltransferase [Gallionella sp.]|nr:TIGR03087 family PEP-CTERM/XrtA system glycosyltransferase [Gallionella sp.]
MKELLFLAHRIPYPPNKGDKIRSFYLLKHLSRHFRVHLGAFVDDPDDWKHVEALSGMVSGELKLLPLQAGAAKLRSAKGLFSGEPLTPPYYHDDAMQAWIAHLIAARPIRQAVVFSSAMAQYLEAYPDIGRIVDFVDIDSDKWRQYAERKAWPMNWVYRREARTLLEYERHIAASFAAATFVSSAEAELFKQLAPECAGHVGYYNNGVNLDYFSANWEFDNPYPQGQRTLVFTGAMDYWANVDAVSWFAREVMPALRRRFADLHFYIVGSRPTAEVQTLAGEGITVTGSVPDVRPYIAHAAISVAPLRIARGIQNKVLEAMAMSKPVVVSPQALEGITADTAHELILAEDAAAFIALISAQLTEPDAAIGLAARRCVERLYSWDTSLGRLDALLGVTPEDTGGWTTDGA